ncbi:MAG: hypothetical protein AABY22_10510, partial [Nanoarchaeota archaeon]
FSTHWTRSYKVRCMKCNNRYYITNRPADAINEIEDTTYIDNKHRTKKSIIVTKKNPHHDDAESKVFSDDESSEESD